MKTALKTVLSSSIICFVIFSYAHALSFLELANSKGYLQSLTITVETIVILSIIGIATNLDIE